MKAELSVKKDVVIVNLSGRIDLEYSNHFREACFKDIGKRFDKIIFNLEELSFVGSNGIMPFVGTLKDLSGMAQKRLRLCGVGSEFRKIFSVSPISGIQIFETTDSAIVSLRNLDFIEDDPA